MRTHKQIVADAGKDPKVAERVGVKPHQIRDWRLRNSIPSEHWTAFVAAHLTTLEELAEAAATKRGEGARAAA